MPTLDERLRQRHAAEQALARQLVDLHASEPMPPSDRWDVAVFQQHLDSVGVTLVSTETRADSTVRIHLAEAAGTSVAAGVLAAQICLECLRRTDSPNLSSLNRHFLQHPPSDHALLAAATLCLNAEDATWCGSFAGLPAPTIIDADDRIETLRGIGPFLGLTDTTFPLVRGTLTVGSRLLILAGSGSTGRALTLLPRTDGNQLGLTELVEQMGREMVVGLEPGFGLTLVGIERRS